MFHKAAVANHKTSVSRQIADLPVMQLRERKLEAQVTSARSCSAHAHAQAVRSAIICRVQLFCGEAAAHRGRLGCL